MLKLAFLTILLLGSSLASPLPQVEDVVDEDSGSKAIFSLFSQLAGVVKKTGDVISKLSENYTDVPVLTQAGEKIGEAGENLPGDFNDIVQDNFQKLLELLPSIKHNITEAMDHLPGIKKKISENIAKLPSSETIKENVQTIFDVLPEHDVVANIKTTFEEHVDKLPSNDYIDDKIQTALNKIPSADIVNSKVDDFVDQISPIVEELNETGGRK
eukprot:TRINITY_DN4751_c0_g1_i2.p1 TRINITY_DN4751_c0_g1~~TRINITY_DN4751_c0_g1_i2.p1  ORF type:complete len:214 (-),score=88.03 TRINITY_DN4751_c0_g1_i2:99-740(-)